MGQVYRATDTRLKRQVALKIVPASLASHPDRLARFQREAEVLASLDHPNIAQIHGLEESDGISALVMELVEGEDLSHRVARGAIPIDEVLPVAKQIAEALEAAHDRGIIHRDLKPANIKVRSDGTVKVLDFGLAKALEPAGSGLSTSRLTNSPTITSPAMMTGVGVLLGTAAYMSPEQAKGKPADKRSDIWAFGCVLYEMLTGRRAFGADDVADTVAAVLKSEPDWTLAPARTQRLLRSCLKKDPKQRLRDLGDAILLLNEETEADSRATTRQPSRSRFVAALAALTLAGLAGGFTIAWRVRPSADRSPALPVRFLLPEIVPQLNTVNGRSWAISPDGLRVAYRAERDGSKRLFLRELRSLQSSPISGTENAFAPFFSPDGQRVGFFAGGKVKAVGLSGGAPVELADYSTVRGAVWTPDDTIIYCPNFEAGLWQVPATGGPPHSLSEPDNTKGERAYRWPELLPGGEAVIFTVATSDISSFDDARLVVRSLRTGEQHEIVRGGMSATYVPASSDLFYARGGGLVAVPFDSKRLVVTGPSRPVLDGIVTHPLEGAAEYSVTPNGTLLYVGGEPVSRQVLLTWVDRAGHATPLSLPAGPYQALSISPDGHRVAVDIDGANANIGILDLDLMAMTRLTSEWSNNSPNWSPDGSRVSYTSGRRGVRTLFWSRLDGQGEPEPLYAIGSFKGQVNQASWAPDGREVVFEVSGLSTGVDLYSLNTAGDRVPRPLLQTKFNESAPAVSPNGQWLAYVSNEIGRNEVYLQPFPGPGFKRRISTEGGTQPRWARDGRELFYRSGDASMAVRIDGSPTPTISRPQLLFRFTAATYAVAPDGRFLMIVDQALTGQPQPVTAVLNWLSEVPRSGAR